MKIPVFVKSILIGVPIGITFFDCVGYVAKVEGVSMQPSLNPNADSTDYVFLSRWSAKNLTLERGNIISLISPKNPNQKIIKRIIGLQGDVISTIGYKKQYVKVPDGHFWIEGDHTGNSLDSNSFGPVSLGLMTATAKCIVWPPSRWQKLQTFIPNQRKPISLGKLHQHNNSN